MSALAAVNGPVKMGDTARFANLRTKAGSKLAKLKELKAKNTLLDKQVAKLEKEAKAAGTAAEKAVSQSKDKNNQLSKEAAKAHKALEIQLAKTNKELDEKNDGKMHLVCVIIHNHWAQRVYTYRLCFQHLHAQES